MSHVADALSLARALLALPLVWALVSDAPVTALVVLGLAVGSDVLDGRLARRAATSADGTAQASAAAGPSGGARRRRGAYLDVCADAVFLLAGLTALWALGRLPVWLPLVATLMLARFFLTSPSSSGLRYDSIGRHYGSMLYAVLAVWLLGASDPAKQAALLVVAIVTAVALVGRTRCLRPATR